MAESVLKKQQSSLLFYMNRHTEKKILRNFYEKRKERRKFVATHIMSIVNKKRRIEGKEKIGSKVDGGECRWNSLHPFWLKRIHRQLGLSFLRYII